MNPGGEGHIAGGPDNLRAVEVELVEVEIDTGSDDPNAIRADIAETRDRMSDTLDEIGERLNPHRVTEQVKDSIREATIGRVENMAQQAADRVNDTRRGIMDTIRENPVPAAMVGLGLGWMMWNGRSSSGSQTSRYRGPDGGTDWNSRHAGAEAFGRTPGRGYAGDEYTDYNTYGADEGGGIVDTIRDRATSIGGTVKDAAGNLTDTVKGAGGTLADRAQSVAGNVAQGTRTGARRVEDLFYGNPLLTGAVTLALGMAAGMAAPRTHPEVALMGDARDQVADRVRDTVEETRHKAEHVVERAVNETKQAARDEGLAAP